MAGPDVSHNTGNEIDVDDATAKRFIERNGAEPIASKPVKETAEKEAPHKCKAVKWPCGWFGHGRNRSSAGSVCPRETNMKPLRYSA